ncbi:hypothetical protein ACWCRF_33250, partial [Streptomyces sp. NPDC002405]
MRPTVPRALPVAVLAGVIAGGAASAALASPAAHARPSALRQAVRTAHAPRAGEGAAVTVVCGPDGGDALRAAAEACTPASGSGAGRRGRLSVAVPGTDRAGASGDAVPSDAARARPSGGALGDAEAAAPAQAPADASRDPVLQDAPANDPFRPDSGESVPGGS